MDKPGLKPGKEQNEESPKINLSLVARGAYGFSLNYFTATLAGNTVNDYKPINTGVTPFVTNVFSLTNTDAATVAKPLFNGNIAAMLVNIPKLASGTAQLYGYAYDQLNRIVSMDAFTGLNNTNNTFTAAATANYKERISYDANGNIKTYLRNGTTTGGTQLAMDNLTYGYNLSGGKLVNNKLRHVQDAIGDANYTDDIDNQATDNYDYDAIGNLIKDTKEGITNITWSVYGKILTITKSGNTISYTYDAGGNRISKTANGKVTWYVRDAGGNVMGVYEQRSDLNSNHLTQSEVHLYGSSRLGIWNRNLDLVNPPTGDITIFERGRKFFELSNHLGNVLVTVSDRKLQVSAGGTTVDYYTADVVSATDNYVFGMAMPGRNYQNDKYRYGFNGKEKDKDISVGDLDFGARIYDGRIGRWLSLDPLQRKYPNESHYAYVSGSPLIFADKDGRDKIITITYIDKDGKSGTTTTVIKDKYINYQRIDKPGFGNDIYVRYDEVVNIVVDFSKGETTYSTKPGTRHEISAATYNWHKFQVWCCDESNRSVQDGGVTLTSEFSSNGADGAKTDARKGSSGIWYVDGFVAAFTALGKSPEIAGSLSELLSELQGKTNELVEKILEDKNKKEIENATKNNATSESPNTKPSNIQNNSTPRIEPGKAPSVYSKYKKGTILYTNTGNVRVDSDSTGTCCQNDKKATDTIPSLKKNKDD